ncbi:MAG: UvrD-helicase domain-containing protein [Deltaproteobacteria bacterium]|nr:UvrD-helicase domain-containing protein [Deltaproteobacteria bacterium]
MSSRISHEIHRLNPRQKEAVLHREGPLLVLAGAGSGKTRVITMRVAHLIDKGVSPEEVLAVTFTNKAAREMKERVRSMLKGSSASLPLISTFHSLCMRILRKEIEHIGYRKDFTIYDTSDQLSLVRNLMSDVKVLDKSVKVESIMERISWAKNGMKPAHDMESSETDDVGALSKSLYSRYQEAMKAFNAVDFDDLLLLTLKLFREHTEVLERYVHRFRYIMVDEYQDTNSIQYQFIRMLAGERMNLCVVGDDDQSIYGWRGADIGNILGFEKDFKGAKVVRLEQNYRSFGYILRAANGVIKNNTKRMGKSLWTERGLGPRIKLSSADNAESEARSAAERISLIKYDKKRKYEDFAIIYRANLLSRPFEEALRKERIPYTVIGGTSYFERKEIKDLAAYLKVIANPADDLSLLKIANIPKRGLGATTLEKFANHAREKGITLFDSFRRAGELTTINEKQAGTVTAFAALLEKFMVPFACKGKMTGAMKELVRDIGYKDYLYELYKTVDVAVRKIENVESFIASMSQYEQDDMESTLQGFLEIMALTDMEESKEEESFGVTLISLHSSKGLEFPVVFLVGMEEGILPHKKSLFTEGGLDEERRLCYVGITRAMEELYISHSNHRSKYGKDEPSSPSRFIDEIPDEVVQREGGDSIADADESDKKAKAFFANIHAMLED